MKVGMYSMLTQQVSKCGLTAWHLFLSKSISLSSYYGESVMICDAVDSLFSSLPEFMWPYAGL